MSTQMTFDQRQDRSDTGPERDVIFTARGSAEASRRIWRTGAMIGYESENYRPPDDLPVEFVDWPFSKLDEFPDVGALFESHLATVEQESPKYAVAPDIDERVPFRDAIEWADELSEYAETVIVVPKTARPAEVPRRFRVGMPCQERYAPTPWKWTAYTEADSVHLLGGSPTTHQEVLKYYVPVESVDTTVPVSGANWGSYWNGEKWADIGFQGDHFYPCLVRSYRGIRRMMNRGREMWEPRCRNRKYDYEQQFKDSAEAELWAEGEVPPHHGRSTYL